MRRELLRLVTETILRRGTNRDIAAIRTGDRATNQQQILLGIDANDLQVASRALDIPKLTRHLPSRKHTCRIRRTANRTDLAVNLLRTVSSALALEIMALHDARRAATLAHTNDIDPFRVAEMGCRQNLTNLKSMRLAIGPKFTIKPLRLTSRATGDFNARRLPRPLPLAGDFGDMTTLRATRQTTRLVREPQLNGLVAIPLGGANLRHHARTGLDNGHGHSLPLLVENLRHADFSAQ